MDRYREVELQEMNRYDRSVKLERIQNLENIISTKCTNCLYSTCENHKCLNVRCECECNK